MISTMKKGIGAVALAALLSTAVYAQRPALQEWKDQKYSMFIHYGAIYSTLGGVWEGKPVTRGYSEQIQSQAGIFSDVYGAVARRFDAPHWNADTIVLLAKAAGMKSVVITSKHHDGFCMFDSEYTDYNIVDATSFKRDVVKELSDACRRHGLKFGLYFSLIDWHFPQAYPISSFNSDPITPEHHVYNKQQITELCTRYGPISELWFDMGSLTAEQSREMADLVHKLQPDCMVSGRLGNDAGDFCVMGDNNYPDYKIATPWQTPASVYDETWGYRSWQQHGPVADKAKEKLAGLIKVVSRGGNYLLNIGPRGDGSIVDFERDVLLQIGQWLQRNRGAIYGASANPFDTTFSWGEVTTKPGRLYLHVLQAPAGGEILLPGLKNRIKEIRTLDDGRPVAYQVAGVAGGKRIKLSGDMGGGQAVRVLEVVTDGPVAITPTHVLSGRPLVLDRHNALQHYSVSGVDYYSSYRSAVAYSWALKASGSKAVQPVLTYTAAERGKTITITMDGREEVVALQPRDSIVLPGTGGLQWGPLYKSGPFKGGIDGTLPSAGVITAGQPFRGKPWAQQADWQPDTRYPLATERDDCWFVMQDITTEQAQDLLLGFSSGDGIQVFLNGQEQAVHNNPVRGTQQEEVLLLPLKAGKNQLIVKYYNRFNKVMEWSINRQVPQVLYRQVLPARKAVTDCKIQLATPGSVHEDMRLPNLSVTL